MAKNAGARLEFGSFFGYEGEGGLEAMLGICCWMLGLGGEDEGWGGGFFSHLEKLVSFQWGSWARQGRRRLTVVKRTGSLGGDGVGGDLVVGDGSVGAGHRPALPGTVRWGSALLWFLSF